MAAGRQICVGAGQRVAPGERVKHRPAWPGPDAGPDAAAYLYRLRTASGFSWAVEAVAAGILGMHQCAPFVFTTPARPTDPAPGTRAAPELDRLAGHASSRTTATIYRHELRPVITTGADVMDKIFTAVHREG